jgi:Arc/MetJ family transcription regulator
MRTTLDLEESLLHEAMKLLGTTTKRETVRQALQALVAQKRRERPTAERHRDDCWLMARRYVRVLYQSRGQYDQPRDDHGAP